MKKPITEKSIVKKAVVRRNGSMSAAHRQNTWLLQWVIRMNPCAICCGSLAEDFNPRYPGKSVTLHHFEGHREIDDWDNMECVANMVICHSECHRRYHLTKRHAESGKKVDAGLLLLWETNIANTISRQNPGK